MAAPQHPTSRRPYLLRAMHEWMTDNGQTPHLVVDAAVDGVVVPRQYVRDGKIDQYASNSSTAGLLIKNDYVSFSARFGGTPFEVRLPVVAVLGIYARETGQGMIFSDDEPAAPPPAGPPSGPPSGPPARPTGSGPGDEPRRPQLKVVK
ncbi:MAG: ClpXP protease specificity-enhancing factor [Pseudomonadota bacterium]